MAVTASAPAVGIVRHVDELGRIVIPKEYRDELGIEPNSEIEILRLGDQIVLRTPGECCAHCEGTGRA